MGKVATHTNAQRIQRFRDVNAAAIDRRQFTLPGDLLTLSNQRRKSAEVIVLNSNELRQNGEDSQAKEGLNIELFPIRQRGLNVEFTSFVLNEKQRKQYLHNSMNRCIRDPYVQWCERLSLPVYSGGAAYSIVP